METEELSKEPISGCPGSKQPISEQDLGPASNQENEPLVVVKEEPRDQKEEAKKEGEAVKGLEPAKNIPFHRLADLLSLV